MKSIIFILTFLLIPTPSISVTNNFALDKISECERAGDWEKAIEDYNTFLNLNSNDTESLITGHFRLGRALDAIGRSGESKKQFEMVSSLYKEYKKHKSINKPDLLDYVAQAKFILNEDTFGQATSPYKDQGISLDKFIRTREMALQKMEKGYDEVISLNLPNWTMASNYKIGLAYELTGYAILHAPLPENTTNLKQDEFFLTLRNKGLPFNDRASFFYKRVISLNQRLKTGEEWTKLANQRIQHLK